MAPDSDPFAIARSRSALFSGRDPANSAAGETAAVLLTQTETLLKRVEADASLLDHLAKQGFGERAIESGTALLAAAEAQIAAAHETGQAHAAVLAQREALWIAAREEYLEFRQTVRTEFSAPSQRKLFHVTGTIHREFSGFVAQATASYRAAAAARTARHLAGRSFDRERIAGACEVLDQLVELERLLPTLDARRRRAADERELALRMLSLWTGELVKSLRLSLGQTRHPPAEAMGSPRRLALGQRGQRGRRERGGERKTLPPGSAA